MAVPATATEGQSGVIKGSFDSLTEKGSRFRDILGQIASGRASMRATLFRPIAPRRALVKGWHVVFELLHLTACLACGMAAEIAILTQPTRLPAAGVETPSSDTKKIGEDWPRWRGPRGDGTWNGPKLSDHWPKGELRLRWRQPIGGGYAGVAVTGDNVLVAELQGGIFERIVCYHAATGKVRWYRGEAAILYARLDHGNGPRATPTIRDGLVYTMGATGKLNCLELASGHLRWSVDLVKEYGGWMPAWGYAASPVIYRETVIVLPGGYAAGNRNSSVVALDRKMGRKVWATLTDPATYATPILFDRGGRTQLVCWTLSHIRGLDAATGDPLWAVPYELGDGVSIASPIAYRDTIFVSGYGSPIRLDEQGRTATLAWHNKRLFDDLISQPLCRDGFVYLLDQRYGLICLELATGKKLWDDKHRMTPRDKYPQATMVWTGDGDRALILNAEGELILAHLNPRGYTELARAKVIGPTWAHPAYAGRYVYARDDHEIVCRELPLADP